MTTQRAIKRNIFTTTRAITFNEGKLAAVIWQADRNCTISDIRATYTLYNHMPDGLDGDQVYGGQQCTIMLYVERDPATSFWRYPKDATLDASYFQEFSEECPVEDIVDANTLAIDITYKKPANMTGELTEKPDDELDSTVVETTALVIAAPAGTGTADGTTTGTITRGGLLNFDANLSFNAAGGTGVSACDSTPNDFVLNQDQWFLLSGYFSNIYKSDNTTFIDTFSHLDVQISYTIVY